MEDELLNIFLNDDDPDVRIIYRLSLIGFNFNKMVSSEGTLLQFCLKKHPTSRDLFHSLLHCGSDMMQINSNGLSAYYSLLVDPDSNFPEDLNDLFKKYSPGLWTAVFNDDIESVRAGVNLWCRTDITKNGMTLKDLALQKGTQDIIRLISNIDSSLQLAHAVMADDVTFAQKVIDKCCCEDSPPPNANLRNMGTFSSTPLCYAVQYNNLEMVHLLINNGASLDVLLQLADESELPVLFLALRKKVSPDILKLLMDEAANKKLLDRLKFKSASPLHFAIDEGICKESLKLLLKYVSAKLLAMRDQFNFTAFDLCPKQSKRQIFEDHLLEIVAKGDQQYLLDLVANGYEYVWRVIDIAPDPPKNLIMLKKLERHIAQFSVAIETGDLEEVQRQLLFSHEGRTICVANCRSRGDGQPPLHKAVIRLTLPIAQLLASVIVGTLHTKIDNVRDQLGRSALCYACVQPEGDAIASMLIEFGASEFSVDKDNRSPAGFRDQRSSNRVPPFLQFHCSPIVDRTGMSEPGLWPGSVSHGGGPLHRIHSSDCRGSCGDHTPPLVSKKSKARCRKELDPHLRDDVDAVDDDGESEVEDDDDDDDDEGTCVLL